VRFKESLFRDPPISVGDLVTPKIYAKFGSYSGSTIQVSPSDHGIVTSVISDAEIECVFCGQPTWWQVDELEVVSDRG
jgi:hypothetical protein